MAIDFTAFSETTDSRFTGSLRATALSSPRRAVLANRSRPRKNSLIGVIKRNDELVSPGNTDAKLYYIRAFAVPALAFLVTWDSTASFCLTQWRFGPIDWAG